MGDVAGVGAGGAGGAGARGRGREAGAGVAALPGGAAGGGGGPEAAARALGCAASSVYAWVAAWRRAGLAGLAERRWRGGPAPRLAGAGEALLTALLAQDPQARGWHATGWTVPLLRTELARAGFAVGERMIRRALHGLGWGWKRPKYVLGRPDPAHAAKKGRSWSGPAPS
ncbi:MAG TPA: helix-turn-helix domain-containing protein [Chloroflexota bacterium]